MLFSIISVNTPAPGDPVLQGFWAVVLAHLVGDFLLQNHAMQKKSASGLYCLGHVAAYMVPYVLFVHWVQFSAYQLIAVAILHYLQDRYGWALKWMCFYNQTSPDKWPQGRLRVDQVMHLLILAIISETII